MKAILVILFLCLNLVLYSQNFNSDSCAKILCSKPWICYYWESTSKGLIKTDSIIDSYFFNINGNYKRTRGGFKKEELGTWSFSDQYVKQGFFDINLNLKNKVGESSYTLRYIDNSTTELKLKSKIYPDKTYIVIKGTSNYQYIQ